MRTRLLTPVVALLAGIGAAAPALARECPLFKAIYAPIDADDDISADAGRQNRYRARHVSKTLQANQARYVFRISELNQKRSYDFSIAYPNGYGGIKLVFSGASETSEHFKPEDDGPGSAIFYFTDKLKGTRADPAGKGMAPAYLMMPEIGVAFWYWPESGRRFVPQSGLWKIIGCDV